MGIVLWFTGLSGSGKSTIAHGLKERFEAMGKRVDVLDGDVIRNKLHKHLGFSREDIRENNRLIAELAKKKSIHTDIVLVPIISPYTEDREMARSIVGSNFVELFLNCPLDTCIERDVKGLYKKALAGEIDNFIGIHDSNPYEPPTHPDVELRTDLFIREECIQKVCVFFEKNFDRGQM